MKYLITILIIIGVMANGAGVPVERTLRHPDYNDQLIDPDGVVQIPVLYDDESVNLLFDLTGIEDGTAGIQYDKTNDQFVAVRNTFDATTPPTASNDITQGYRRGSKYYDANANQLYECTSPAEGAAVWIDVQNIEVTDLADVAVSGSYNDLTDKPDILDRGTSENISSAWTFQTGLKIREAFPLRWENSSGTSFGDMYFSSGGFYIRDQDQEAKYHISDTQHIWSLGGITKMYLEDGELNLQGNNLANVGSVAGISSANLLDKSANESISGDWTFNGDLIIQGSTIQVDSEITTADTVISINDGEVGAGVTLGYAGTYIDRGSENPYFFGFDEVRDGFVVGSITELTAPQIATTQVIATREDSPTDGYFAKWNDTAKRFDAVQVDYSDLTNTPNFLEVQGDTNNGIPTYSTVSGGFNVESYLKYDGGLYITTSPYTSDGIYMFQATGTNFNFNYGPLGGGGIAMVINTDNGDLSLSQNNLLDVANVTLKGTGSQEVEFVSADGLTQYGYVRSTATTGGGIILGDSSGTIAGFVNNVAGGGNIHCDIDLNGNDLTEVSEISRTGLLTLDATTGIDLAYNGTIVASVENGYLDVNALYVGGSEVIDGSGNISGGTGSFTASVRLTEAQSVGEISFEADGADPIFNSYRWDGGSGTSYGFRTRSTSTGHALQVANSAVIGSHVWSDALKFSYSTGAATFSSSVVVGTPTGGNKGAGTINATAVYDDNVLLTDYVFEKEFLGYTLDEKKENYSRKSLEEEVAFVKEHLHLSTITGRKKWEKKGPASTGQLISELWETSETQFLYLAEMMEKIKINQQEILTLKKQMS